MPHEVIMPALGMSQDTGLIVAWHKAPGEAVVAGDLLLEVETDKSTMEVEADRAGFVAALYAAAGEEVPVGNVIAEISAEKPMEPVAARPIEAPRRAPAVEQTADAAPPPVVASAESALAPVNGRILASPKTKRLAAERDLDLKNLVVAGVPQPYHVADLDKLRTIKGADEAPAQESRHVTARVPADGLASFCDWMEAESGAPPEQEMLLAAFAGASFRGATSAAHVTVAAGRLGVTRLFSNPDWHPLGKAPESDSEAPALIVRDLRKTAITGARLGAEQVPVLSVTEDGADLRVTFESEGDTLSGPAVLQLVADFAVRLEQPLMHLL